MIELSQESTSDASPRPKTLPAHATSAAEKASARLIGGDPAGGGGSGGGAEVGRAVGKSSAALSVRRGEGPREGKGGVASIFGVAFDDYIGEEGVRLPSTMTTGPVAWEGGGGSATVESSDVGGGSGKSRACIEEDRR